jgi:hypothetical protein
MRKTRFRENTKREQRWKMPCKVRGGVSQSAVTACFRSVRDCLHLIAVPATEVALLHIANHTPLSFPGLFRRFPALVNQLHPNRAQVIFGIAWAKVVKLSSVLSILESADISVLECVYENTRQKNIKMSVISKHKNGRSRSRVFYIVVHICCTSQCY